MGGHRQVLIVDDDALLRDTYRALIARSDDFVVCGEASTGLDGVAQFRRLRPDVVLMDIQMPQLSGVDATARICEEFPGATIVMLTTFSTREFVTAALRAGAAGYLLKDASASEILEALEQALSGDMPLSGGVRRELVSALEREPERRVWHGAPLTPRELDVLQQLAHGLTNQEIGAALFVSSGSVKQYLANIGTKFGTTSRTQILVTAIRHRLVDLDALPS